MRQVDFFLDFVSPYTYLALTQAPEFARRHEVVWNLRPVVYGVLLERSGLVGPAEVDVKRRYTFTDIQRSAALLGVPLVGPPAHPFRSLEALRLLALETQAGRGLDLALALAAAAWGAGRDLTRIETLADVLDSLDLDSANLAERIRAPECKQRLRSHTDDALAAGLFGVPTFAYRNELFWGHDRLPHLAARLQNRVAVDSVRTEEMLARPRGIDRGSRPPSS